MWVMTLKGKNMTKDTSGRRQVALSLLLLVFLFMPNIAVLFGNEELNGMVVKKAGYLIVSAIILLLPALFLKRKVYFLFEGLFTLFAAPIELSSIYLNHNTTNFMIMDTIISTNVHEALELLSSIWYVVVIAVVLCIAYFVTVIRYCKNDYLIPQWGRKTAYIVIPLVLIGGFTYFFVLAHSLMTSQETSLKTNLIDVKDMMTDKFNKLFPFDVYLATKDVLEFHQSIEEEQEHLANFTFGIPPKADSTEETIVLVIGETARWENFGINGYQRNTTPNLKKEKNLVSYSHTATQANLTSNSVPLIVTRANALNAQLANEEKSVSEAFQEAGFQTAWISNQEASAYLSRIIETSDQKYVLNSGIRHKSLYDTDLIEPFRQALKSKSKKKFVVIHSLGSHFKYCQRYPASCEIFKPCFSNNMDLMSITPENVQLLVNAYDNSIVCTDQFLGQVLQTLKAKGGIWSMIYLSDHGENLFDDERKLIMHGTLIVSEYEAHIPFIVAYSEDFKNRYPTKVESIMTNKDKNITSEVVFHSLLDLADLKTPVIADSLSICRPTLTSKTSTYILNGNRELVKFEFGKKTLSGSPFMGRGRAH